MPSDNGRPLAGEPATTVDGAHSYVVADSLTEHEPYIVKLSGASGARYAEVEYKEGPAMWYVERFLEGGLIEGRPTPKLPPVSLPMPAKPPKYNTGCLVAGVFLLVAWFSLLFFANHLPRPC